MDREAGLELLSRNGWLSGTPEDFRASMLSGCGWHCLEPGASIQVGGEQDGALTGIAGGTVELRTTLGRADTPIMHFARPVFWFGYARLISPSRPHRIEATAKTKVWLAQVSVARIRQLLNAQPELWQYFLQPAFFFADLALNVAADLMIRDSERRCAAVLLRMSGRRFNEGADAEPALVVITQDELAGAANLSRSSARSMLQRLAARGLIEQEYSGIVLHAPAALRAFVDEG